MAVRQYKTRKGLVVPDKWFIDYYPKGAKGRKVVEVFEGTKDEAYEYEMEVRRTHISATDMPTNPKIADLFAKWKEWLQLHRSESYYYDVVKTLKWLLPHFGNYQVSKLTKTVINQYKKARPGLSKRGNSCVRAINKELGNLGALIAWAAEENYCHPLPFKIEKLPFHRPIPQIPHPVEFDRFLSAIQPHGAYLREAAAKNAKPGFEERRRQHLKDVALKRSVVLFMWRCGLRWKEATHVRWENIDWMNGTVMLAVTKGGRPRYAVFVDEIAELLAPFRQDEGWVFENPKTGKPWSSFKTLFRTTCKKAGIKRIHPHLLRHACGTLTLEATGDLRLVQDLLGHRNVSTTQFYTQIATHRLKAGASKTADYISSLKSSKGLKNKDQS